MVNLLSISKEINSERYLSFTYRALADIAKENDIKKAKVYLQKAYYKTIARQFFFDVFVTVLKRAEIQKKIKELDKKRRSFIIKKQKEGSQKDVLNNVMIKAIKRQAKLKNYSW